MSNFPNDFAKSVVDLVPFVLKQQEADGRMGNTPGMPFPSAQNSILGLAFCYAGLDPEKKYYQSKELKTSIERLTNFLTESCDHKGQFTIESYGHKLRGTDQRLTYAWIEAFRILRATGDSFDFHRWEPKIIAACETLIDHRLKHLVGVKRFIGKVAGTGMNHVVLYLSTIYRAGQVLNRKDLCDFTLPIARALANDIHPDGYWEEHNDLSREIGPTPLYNFLSHCGMALMYEWTKEKVFKEAIEKSTRFYQNFTYPDGKLFDLIDERVRYYHYPQPQVWGLFGFSHSAEGRGLAQHQFNEWSKYPVSKYFGEEMARNCENFMYWHSGTTSPAPYTKPDHRATLTLPAGIFRQESWCIGLSGMRATIPEDLNYRENPFALDRQRLFSVWHEKLGLIIDGSHSKSQPENSTFACLTRKKHWDYWPCRGSIDATGTSFSVAAMYKTFEAKVTLTPIDKARLQMEFSADFTASTNPIFASFTLCHLGKAIQSMSGKTWNLDATPFHLSSDDLDQGFVYGGVRITSDQEFHLDWPFIPYGVYTADHSSPLSDYLVRMIMPLTPAQPLAKLTLFIS
jgi:hypothetical protein